MIVMTVPTLIAPDLAERLRGWARGDISVSSAIELLIAHDFWLADPGFVAACVDVFEGYDFVDGLAPMACIRWNRVPGFLDQHPSLFDGQTVSYPAPVSAILALATELAGVDTKISLDELLHDLDGSDTILVISAIARATARHTQSPSPERHTPPALRSLPTAAATTETGPAPVATAGPRMALALVPACALPVPRPGYLLDRQSS